MKRLEQDGFSLLEILVAFSILALSLGILMQIFSTSLRNADISTDQAQAVSIAQSLLAAAGVESPLAEGGTSGVIANKFHWRIDTAPVQSGDPNLNTNAQPLPTSLQLWEVGASVEWGGTPDMAGRKVSLHTMRVQVTPRP